jgi:predicted enzyme related to lactoylglutathione lyase
MVAVYREDNFVQAQTPGARDVLVLERASGSVGKTGSVAHFGFRLTRPDDIGAAIVAVRDAGGTVLESGEVVPGEPYAFVRDVDGYTVVMWYEIPTSVDP